MDKLGTNRQILVFIFLAILAVGLFLATRLPEARAFSLNDESQCDASSRDLSTSLNNECFDGSGSDQEGSFEDFGGGSSSGGSKCDKVKPNKQADICNEGNIGASLCKSDGEGTACQYTCFCPEGDACGWSIGIVCQSGQCSSAGNVCKPRTFSL